MAEALAEQAAALEDPIVAGVLDSLRVAVAKVSKSFSGSWYGYHSRVYYAGFNAPPPGAHFSQEWGLKETLSGLGSRGDWRECSFDEVKEYVMRLAGSPNLDSIQGSVSEANRVFDSLKSEAMSVLHNELADGGDSFVESLRDQLSELEVLSDVDVIRRLQPRGQIMTRDSIVIGQGMQVPPHMLINAQLRGFEHSIALCIGGARILQKAASHLERKAKRHVKENRVGTNVFIGHGRSAAWRDLKDFVQDRLRLPWDEFNRVPVAGVTNIERLSQMLDGAAIAFLIMTAEDEQADGSVQARMNVIHEAGLFQGRLGFAKAIVLLEEGCAEFSNIAGLGQIRFPPGNISAAFEEIRRVLERDGLIL